MEGRPGIRLEGRCLLVGASVMVVIAVLGTMFLSLLFSFVRLARLAGRVEPANYYVCVTN
jgi:hypothetical protein